MRLIARTPIKHLVGADRREAIISPGRAVPPELLIPDFEADDEDDVDDLREHELVRIGAVEIVEDDEELFHADAIETDLRKMNTAQLRATAAAEEIDLPASAKSKGAMADAIETARAAKLAAAEGQA